MRRLLGDIHALVAAWWRVDRVRTRVDDGRLLMLAASTRVRVRHGVVVVRERRLAADGGAVYTCGDGAGRTRVLTVRPTGRHLEPEVELDGEAVLACDVEVWRGEDESR